MKKIKGLFIMLIVALPALFSLAGCTEPDPADPTKTVPTAFGKFMSPWGWIGLLAVVVIAWFFFSGSRRKKQAQEGQNMLNSIQPGTHVMTQGGVIGKVIEVKVISATEKHVVLETGSDEHKSYITYDIRAIGIILRPEQLVARTTPLEPVMPTDEEIQKRLDEVYTSKEAVPAPETIFETPAEPIVDAAVVPAPEIVVSDAVAAPEAVKPAAAAAKKTTAKKPAAKKTPGTAKPKTASGAAKPKTAKPKTEKPKE